MSAWTRPTVLIVEDEDLIREVVAAEFADAGYNVLQAIDDVGAFAHLTADRPIHLLFTDIRLPGAHDGWMIALKARELRPGLPVFYATGFSDRSPQLVPGGLFFRKPYRPMTIVEAARELGIGVPD